MREIIRELFLAMTVTILNVLIITLARVPN